MRLPWVSKQTCMGLHIGTVFRTKTVVKVVSVNWLKLMLSSSDPAWQAHRQLSRPNPTMCSGGADLGRSHKLFCIPWPSSTVEPVTAWCSISQRCPSWRLEAFPRVRRRIMLRHRRILVIIAEPQNARRIGRPSSFLLV